MKKVKKGFTLIELVVVIAVIAILSAVSVVAYIGITNNAKKSAAQQEADQIGLTVRAAALTSADGYTEQYDRNFDQGENKQSARASDEARYKVTWTQAGLVFEKLNGSTIKISEILEDMYEELEEKALNEGVELSVDSAIEDAFASASPSSAVNEMFYETNSYSKKVSTKFVK